MVWSLLLLGNLRQQPGLTTWDTKYDLTADPGGFLARSLHLWNPQASFGELQNQAYGYLFPHGTYFWLADRIGVPDWIAQRLWSTLLLIVAYEGARSMARSLGQRAFPAVLAGLVYALAPRLLGAVGVLTGETLPVVILPWAAIPLVMARSGRLTARQAGLWSGVAVLCMGGVNAVGTLATFPLLIALVLTQIRRPHGRRLAAWWAVAVTAASTWWLLPLLLLGRYSPPFLDFIETAAATTAPTGWANAVRGNEHWLSYATAGGRPWWPAAYELATSPVLMVAAGVVATVGLVGLAHRTMPLRAPLVAVALIGLLCLTAGNVASGGSLVDGWVRDLLDGPLAPFRNVHKVDPLIRLPLALGFGHAVAVVLGRVADVGLRRWIGAAMVAVVAIGAAPMATGDLRMPGFERAPQAWADAADFLAERPDSRALVVPGAGFGIQTWGWTIDEPIQGVARSPWATRSQVPLVPGPTARYLDTIERRIADGRGGPGLAAMLARGGVTHLVLRRDLDASATDTLPTDRVTAALDDARGIRRVAGFGDTGFAGLPLIDIYAVRKPVPPVRVVDTGVLTTLSGSPDDLLPALDTRAIGAEPVLIGSADEDLAAADSDTHVVGDAYTRRSRQFGRVHDALGDVLGAEETVPEQRRTIDFPGVPGVPPVTARPRDGATLSASSSRGYVDDLGAIRPEFAPASAMDGDPATEWRSGSLRTATGQWLQVDLAEPAAGGVASVRFGTASGDSEVRRARVTFGLRDGEDVTAVYGVPPNGRLLVPLPFGHVDRMRTTVVEIARPHDTAPVAVTEIEIPGIAPGRSLVLPAPVRAGNTVVLSNAPPRRPCLDLGFGPRCTLGDARPMLDGGRLDRIMTIESTGTWRPGGQVVALPSAATAAFLTRVGRELDVTADSVLGNDPSVTGARAVDDDPRTAWLSEPGADQARLVLTWPGVRTISGLRIRGANGAVTPRVARLSAGGRHRVVPLGLSTRFKPMKVDGRLEITFDRPAIAGTSKLPIGISDLRIDGMRGLIDQPALQGRFSMPCGLGPRLQIDGRTRETAVVGSLADIRDGTPLKLRVCGRAVTLTAGEHRVVVEPTAQFAVTNLTWRPEAAPASRGIVDHRWSEVTRWDAAERAVQVGAGAESVLIVTENVNDGWSAELDGRQLRKVTVDGWQQGYVIPAGEGGTVRLVFEPDRTYRTALLVGMVLAGLLVIGAVVGQLRERRGRRSPAVADRPVAAAVDSPGAVASWAARVVAGGGLLVLGGPVAGVGFLLASWRRSRGVVGAGAVLVLVSAVLSAVDDGRYFGSSPVLAHGAAAAGVGLILGSLWRADRGRHLGASTVRTRVSRARAVAARWLRQNPTTVVALLLVVGQAVLRWHAAAGSFWWQDDFLHLDLAETEGLSREFLIRDYSGHLEAGQYMIFWLVNLADSPSFLPAVLILVGLQSVAAVLLLVLLRMLFGRSPWLLVPFAGYLFTPLAVATSTWFAAGLQAYTLQIGMLVAAIGLVRHRIDGRRRWLLVSIAGHLFALACWEKALLVLPLLVGLEVLVLARGVSWRQRARLLVNRWPLWAAHLLLVAAYLAVYLSVVDAGSVAGDDAPSGVGEALRAMFLRTLVPGLLGGPWDVSGADNTVFPETPVITQWAGALAILALVVASLVRRRTAAIGPWLLVVGYLAGDALLVLVGRANYLSLVAADPRYLTDALPVIVVGVCAAFAGPRHEPSRGRRRPVPGRLVRAVPYLLAVALVASSLTTTLRLLPRAQHEDAGRFVRAVIADVRSDPAVSLFTRDVDDALIARSVGLESVLRSMGYPLSTGRPGERLRVVADDGRVVPGTVRAIDVDRRGPKQDCGWSLDGAPRRLGVLPTMPEAPDGVSTLLLEYLGGEGAILHVSIGGSEQAVQLGSGLGRVYLDATDRSGEILAWMTEAGGEVCVVRYARGVATARP